MCPACAPTNLNAIQGALEDGGIIFLHAGDVRILGLEFPW
jgi:hypothetical protein